MSVATPTATQEATKAGNYFVSNYPPYSFWTTDQVPELHKRLDQSPKPGTPLGLYIHLPFCRKRCHFCYFRVYTDKNAAEIAGYLEHVLLEARRYAAYAAIKGRPLKFLYVGGGTPSYLSSEQLRALMTGLGEIFPMHELEEVTFECEPGTLTPKKLQAIRELGVTRLSLGVEHVDDAILEANGRAHRSAEIFRAYEAARALDFPQINVDLIAGMLNDTDEGWMRAVVKTIELAPDCVTIYQMEVPHNTTLFKQMTEVGSTVAPVADWETKRRWVSEAFACFRAAGYTVTSAYTVVRDPARTKFVYRDALWTGADLLGLGVASFSHLQGVHFQNQHHLDLYETALDKGGLPVFRAYATQPEELVIRELILQLKTGSADPAWFSKKFGVNIAENFAAQWESMRERGFLAPGSDLFQLTEPGLLRVDRLLHDFFLPHHRNARYT